MDHQMLVLPLDRRVAVGADQTLLQAALAAGVVLPSSCRNGSCRTCMCRLVDGRIGYRIAWPGLLAEEKAEGWILPCVAYPAGDVVIESPHAVHVG
ncbi:2Fe-2S iron-sulfur cluster-binding protein [Aquabacterium humicola]|uniref:2Fe-2S iron-sulfur cluster-binding protein n=1 Tax=Aquabacterium humicola TaxID=3237377 RepID=UPI00254270FB|nr:2Fe-2S iron-sulfur cluster-binding protein [Rubrivivax pictus]